MCKVGLINGFDVDKEVELMYRTKDDKWNINGRKDANVPLFDRVRFQTWLRVYLRLFVLLW